MITIFKCTNSHTLLNDCSSGDLFILICRHNKEVLWFFLFSSRYITHFFWWRFVNHCVVAVVSLLVYLFLDHLILYSKEVRDNNTFVYCPSWLEWGCIIDKPASLQTGKTPSNGCPEYVTKQSNGNVPVILELMRMRSTPLLLSLPDPLWLGVVASDRVLSIGQIKLNCVLMLNWIAWNRSVLTFKLRTCTKPNGLKWNCFCMLKWNIWNRTVLSLYLR